MLREALKPDACFVSGGLGPTHDDRTVELVARAAGLELVVDEALEQEIEAISRAVSERLRRPYADFAPGVTKQATRPVSATSLGLAGTAPGLVLRAPTGCVVVVLPGPPGELRRLWPTRSRASRCVSCCADAAAGAACAATVRRQRVRGRAGARGVGRRR